jgi:MFS family permease
VTSTARRVATPGARPGRVDHDGGTAWIVVLGSFIGHIPVFGTVYSFTVLFDPIADEFGASSGATAWIVSIASAAMMGMAVFSGRLSERFGAPPVAIAGGALIATGFLLTASTGALWQLYVTFGLVVGAGLSSITMPSFGVISRRFTRRRGLAIGIASAGSGFASLVVAPLTEALVDSMGWRDALRVLAVVHFVLAIVAASLLRGDRRALPHQRDRLVRLLRAVRVPGAVRDGPRVVRRRRGTPRRRHGRRQRGRPHLVGRVG